jgi:CRP-like cAMP-binding protein
LNKAVEAQLEPVPGLRRLVAKIEQLSSHSALKRVTEFLLRLCPADQGPAEIELPQDKVLIAARLNMQPETLSRVLARLRAHGVTTVGSRVVIADVEQLRRLAQRSSP